MTQRPKQHLQFPAPVFRAAVRALRLAVAGVMALVAIAPQMASAEPAKTNLDDLVISGAKIINRKTKAIVLDADNLASSLEGAGKYFDVTKGQFEACGDYKETGRSFHYELRLNGAVIACANVGSSQNLGPYYAVISGPIRDSSGNRPGDRLTRLQNFKPLRDCKPNYGYMWCVSKRPANSTALQPQHQFTLEGGCNGAELVSPEEFRLKKGNFKVCVFTMYGRDPQH